MKLEYYEIRVLWNLWNLYIWLINKIWINLWYANNYKFRIYIALNISFKLKIISTSNQITFKIIGISPNAMRIVLLIIGLYLFEFLLFLMIHAHKFDPGILIDPTLSHGCSGSRLGYLNNNFSLLIFASIIVDLFLISKLFACPPHCGIFGVQVVDLVRVEVAEIITVLDDFTRRLPLA